MRAVLIGWTLGTVLAILLFIFFVNLVALISQ